MKKILFILIGVIIVGFVAFSFIRANKKTEDDSRKFQALVLEKGEFVTATGSVHATSSIDEYLQVANINIPFTNKELEVEYDRYFDVGYKVENMKFEVDGKKITITLPPAEILKDYVDEKTIVTHEKNNILNQIKIDEDLKKCFEKYYDEDLAQAKSEGLMETAESSAKSQLESILSPDGKYDVEVLFE